MQSLAGRYFEAAAVANGNRGGLDSDGNSARRGWKEGRESERISSSLTRNWMLDKHTCLNGTSWH